MELKSERHDVHTVLWWEISEFRGFIQVGFTLSQTTKTLRESRGIALLLYLSFCASQVYNM